jgi:BirA family biotin operon repressor/biotin-[acetyl-CoA-carboxylase] ligase
VAARLAGHDPAETARHGLLRDGLLALGPDGELRPGPRSSGLSEERVRVRRAGKRYGRAVEILAFTASTNDLALERASTGAAPGSVVAAELQTAGRGRRGRSFESRAGLGIWSTTLLDAPADVARAPRLSLIAALALAEAVESLTGARVGVKWPNDLLIADRKIAGVLVEARSVGGRVFPVAGIGVNVHHREGDFPEGLRATAGSVEGRAGVRVDRSELLAALLGRLEHWVAEEQQSAIDLSARFSERDVLHGLPVKAEGPEGGRTGTADGIDEDGALRLLVPGRGVVRILSGEASVRRASSC